MGISQLCFSMALDACVAISYFKGWINAGRVVFLHCCILVWLLIVNINSSFQKSLTAPAPMLFNIIPLHDSFSGVEMWCYHFYHSFLYILIKPNGVVCLSIICIFLWLDRDVKLLFTDKRRENCHHHHGTLTSEQHWA